MSYHAPATLDAAIELLAGAKGNCRVLAGGTDLLVRMRSDAEEVDAVLDVKRIEGMRDIAEEDGGWRIGAAVSGMEVSEHAGLGAAWPGVVEAASLIGSVQIRGRATLVGNLCNASPAADSVPAMAAAAATARIAGPSGTRDIPVEEVASGPGRTTLADGEIVTSVFLPARPAHASDAYLRLIPRTEMDIAVVGCGVSLALDGDGACAEARVALGAVAPTVIVVDEAAQAIAGTQLDDAALDALAAACSDAAKPIDDKRGTVAYRKRVAGVLARRAAVAARERAGGKP